MSTDQLLTALIPTAAVLLAVLRNESAVNSLKADINSLREDTRQLGARLDARIETLTARVEAVDRDLRDWSKIVMQHNTDVARLKDKVGLDN